MSNLSDFIFLPLDVDTNPPYNKKSLLEWIHNNYPKLLPFKDRLITAEKHLPNSYPWDLTPVFWNMFDDGPGWLNGFDKDFADLSAWFISNYNLDINDVGAIVFLPMKPTYSGWGFWHLDIDPFGLRVLLDCDIDNEKLFVKKFKEYYPVRPQFGVPLPEALMESELLECKISHPCQSHMITHRLAGHATYTEVPNKERLCVQIMNKATIDAKANFGKSLEPIMVRSAEKFKDSAIFWQ